MSYSLLNAGRATHSKIIAVATAATVAFAIVGATAHLPSSAPSVRASAETFFDQGHVNLYAKVPTRPSARFEPPARTQMPMRFALNRQSNEAVPARGPKRDRLSLPRTAATNNVVIRNDPDVNTTYAAKRGPAIEVKARKTVVCESPFGGALTLTDLDVFVRCVATGPRANAAS
jgi:hypothetical protein